MAHKQLSWTTQMTDDVLDLFCRAALSEHGRMTGNIVLAPPGGLNSNELATTLSSLCGNTLVAKVSVPDLLSWSLGIWGPGVDDDSIQNAETLDSTIASSHEDLWNEWYKQLSGGAKFMSACFVGIERGCSGK
ncbi:hypothetical protein NM208_g983 [Fusarium decemcellulare]|uniref:Uncharacterized protein n=1 Tax=Fusarium decemcellulare TaxID=57161 RepID=A0ACC1SXM7_9HYPO|nr:hypothetical protein NM208_g983 [Fusarium decemcellulare]